MEKCEHKKTLNLNLKLKFCTFKCLPSEAHHHDPFEHIISGHKALESLLTKQYFIMVCLNSNTI